MVQLRLLRLAQVACFYAYVHGAAVRWVFDDSVALLDCPILFDSRTNETNTHSYDRDGNCKHSSTQKWHAILKSPYGADIPSSVLTGSPELDGKIIFIVGDSLAYGQFVDLLCSLHARRHNVVMVNKNRQDPNLIGVHVAEVQAANGTTFWVVFNSFGNLRSGGHEIGRYATGSVAKIKAHIASSKSAYRGTTPSGAIVQLSSVKAHSLSRHGYRGFADGGVAAYFKDLLVFKEYYGKLVDAELFYYRPAFATHFATSNAGYIPDSHAAQLPCTRIDSSVNLTNQKIFFMQEESQLERRSKDVRFAVIPNVWDMSVDMWYMHPSLTHAVTDTEKSISDCLHFCNLGNAYHGMYEAVNRWFWWDMLGKLKQKDRLKQVWNPSLDHS